MIIEEENALMRRVNRVNPLPRAQASPPLALPRTISPVQPLQSLPRQTIETITLSSGKIFKLFFCPYNVLNIDIFLSAEIHLINNLIIIHVNLYIIFVIGTSSASTSVAPSSMIVSNEREENVFSESDINSENNNNRIATDHITDNRSAGPNSVQDENIVLPVTDEDDNESGKSK